MQAAAQQGLGLVAAAGGQDFHLDVYKRQGQQKSKFMIQFHDDIPRSIYFTEKIITRNGFPFSCYFVSRIIPEVEYEFITVVFFTYSHGTTLDRSQYMDKLITPFIVKEHFPNHACDRFMALVGKCLYF